MGAEIIDVETRVGYAEVIDTPVDSNPFPSNAVANPEPWNFQESLDNKFLGFLSYRVPGESWGAPIPRLNVPGLTGRVSARHGEPIHIGGREVTHSGIDTPIPQGTLLYTRFSAEVVETGFQHPKGTIPPDLKTGLPDPEKVHPSATLGVVELEVIDGPYKGSRIRMVHFSNITLQPGQVLQPGDLIALSGGQPGTAGAGYDPATGKSSSTGPHLDFRIFNLDGQEIDPLSDPQMLAALLPWWPGQPVWPDT